MVRQTGVTQRGRWIIFVGGLLCGVLIGSLRKSFRAESSESFAGGDAGENMFQRRQGGPVAVRGGGFPQEAACGDVVEAPKKVPVVLVMGTTRTGTTLVYNVVKRAMDLRDPNTLSGFFTDLAGSARAFSTHPSASVFEAVRSMSVPVVTKLHLMEDVVDFFGTATKSAADLGVDVVYINYRDLRRQVLSAKRMNWQGDVRPEDFSRPDFCVKKAGRRPLKPSEWNKPKTWVIQAQAIIHCNEKILKWAEGTKVVPLKYEELPKEFCDGSGRTWLNDILGALPMPESGTEEPRDLLCKAVERLRPVTCQSKMAVHPLTQLHRGHIGNYGNLSKAELAGMMAIEADPTCLQWLKGRGYLDGFGEV